VHIRRGLGEEFLRVADYEIPPIQAVGSDEEF